MDEQMYQAMEIANRDNIIVRNRRAAEYSRSCRQNDHCYETPLEKWLWIYCFTIVTAILFMSALFMR